MGVLLSSSLARWGIVFFKCLTQPNVLRKDTSGFLPCQASNGVVPSKLLVGARFRMNTAVLTASPQNAVGIFLAFNMLLAMPTTVWFLLSTTPFCCGEYGAVRWCSTPYPAQ